MKSIYPKVDVNLKGIHKLKKYIDKYKGLELQCLDFDKKTGNFSFADEVRAIGNLFPNTKEINIHPPLEFCDLEMFCCGREQALYEAIETMKILTEEFSLHMNLILHTHWNLSQHQMLTIPFLKELINRIKGYDIYIVLENMCFIDEKKCTVLELCKFIGDSQLKVCLDVCHMKCNALLWKMDMQKYAKMYLQAKDCNKYVHFVHFASLPPYNGLGLQEAAGVVHTSQKELVEDVELLYAYGMYSVPFVTSIHEEKEEERREQLREIDGLEDIYKLMQML